MSKNSPSRLDASPAPRKNSPSPFAFVISFDEVIITIFLSGAHETIPKKMFNELVLRVNPTITAIATLLIAVSIVTITLIVILGKRGGFLQSPR